MFAIVFNLLALNPVGFISSYTDYFLKSDKLVTITWSLKFFFIVIQKL